jgi:multiple sugar transport system permease protein
MPALGPSAPPLRRRREILTAYLLLAPALVLVLGFLAYPIGWEVWASLTDRSVERLSTRYVGLYNYVLFLNDPDFWTAARNTLGYLVLTGALKLAVGLVVALSLSRTRRGRPVALLAAFLPWTYPAGAAMIGWSRFLSPPVHTAYSIPMGNLAAAFDRGLGTGTWGFLTLVALNIWRGGSFTGIFLLAALKGIPQELFDYAALEVRDAWSHFRQVTLPLLRPFLALAAFLSLTTAVADLGNAWLQTGGRDVYPIIWTHSFQYALLAGQWGKASALSLILVPLLAVFLFACYHLFEPIEDAGA